MDPKTFTTKQDRETAAIMRDLLQASKQRNRGRRVKILVGKYAGREALIDGISFNVETGFWLFLCMVQKLDGTGHLNSDAESRTYRPTMDIDFIRSATL